MEQQNAIKPYVIGLDLGGTNSVFGIVDARGEIKATTAIKTGGYEKVEDYVAACVDALQVIIEQVGGIDKIKAMGIGAPNGNYYKGTIEFAPNLPWAHNGVVPLGEMFSKALGIPVALTNDRYEELHCHHTGNRCRLGYRSKWSTALWPRRFRR